MVQEASQLSEVEQLDVNNGHNPEQAFPEVVIQTTTKCMIRCSTSFVLRKIRVKTTMEYYYTSTTVAKILKDRQFQVLAKNVEQLELSHMVQPPRGRVCQSPRTGVPNLSPGPAQVCALLGTGPRSRR